MNVHIFSGEKNVHIFQGKNLNKKCFLESQFDQSNHVFHLWSAKMKKVD